ncbi:cytochrome C oxidase subunit IV [Flavobacterium haoranii]|uniref:Cbb3-type cytochrome oxidase component FixQ n=1 Tax=Flavobacterium haoranii TaxID=683124 RepID=A0A1M6KRT7_9FLAO|nr:cytochrome C oxidase subunit IV [Flavobacterium haoranii]SHJ61669.1 hypothetical protein SAMN05444337_2278 [Flavobacterium haoranii]
MLKFVKHNLETITDVEVYPIISLAIFFVVFVAFFVWAMTYSKEKINELSDLPFKEN